MGLNSPLAFDPSYSVCRLLLRSASGLVASGTVAAIGCRDMPFCFLAPEAPGRVRLDARVREDCRESEGERLGVCGPVGESARGEMGEGDLRGGDMVAIRPGGGETMRAEVGERTRGALRGDHAVGGGEDTLELGVGEVTRDEGVGEPIRPLVGDVTLNVGEPMRGSPNWGWGRPNCG